MMILRWILTLALAFLAGKLITKLRMPSILGLWEYPILQYFPT
ncbi:MAG: hypothetical protein SPF19_11520 [Oliverpabstia sp.]|nr:hypothetical protein [Oliverpabstia sp.]